jgi:hypothetical protein
MATRKLDKRQWHTFFDRISRLLEGKQAEIEVASLALGDQVEAEWLPLVGIEYDPKDDLVEVALEGLDHLIPKPREIYGHPGIEQRGNHRCRGDEAARTPERRAGASAATKMKLENWGRSRTAEAPHRSAR